MEEVIKGIYEKGILKPLKKLNLKEGEKVKIEIKKKRGASSLFNVIQKYEKYFENINEDLTQILIKEREKITV